MTEAGHDFEKIAPYYDLALQLMLFLFGGENRFRKKNRSFRS